MGWKNGINRPDWEPSQNSRVCSLHFKESDYQVYSKDSQIRRKRSRPSEELQRKYLLPSAVPSFSRILESDPLKDSWIQSDEDQSHTEKMDTSISTLIENRNKMKKVKVEDSFSNNPWCVDDASAFL